MSVFGPVTFSGEDEVRVYEMDKHDGPKIKPHTGYDDEDDDDNDEDSEWDLQKEVAAGNHLNARLAAENSMLASQLKAAERRGQEGDACAAKLEDATKRKVIAEGRLRKASEIYEELGRAQNDLRAELSPPTSTLSR